MGEVESMLFGELLAPFFVIVVGMLFHFEHIGVAAFLQGSIVGLTQQSKEGG